MNVCSHIKSERVHHQSSFLLELFTSVLPMLLVVVAVFVFIGAALGEELCCNQTLLNNAIDQTALDTWKNLRVRKFDVQDYNGTFNYLTLLWRERMEASEGHLLVDDRSFYRFWDPAIECSHDFNNYSVSERKIVVWMMQQRSWTLTYDKIKAGFLYWNIEGKLTYKFTQQFDFIILQNTTYCGLRTDEYPPEEEQIYNWGFSDYTAEYDFVPTNLPGWVFGKVFQSLLSLSNLTRELSVIWLAPLKAIIKDQFLRIWCENHQL